MNGAGPGPEAVAFGITLIWLFYVGAAIALASLVGWLALHPQKVGTFAFGAVAAIALAMLSGAAWP